MSPKRDVSAERKTQILKAASTVFARKGFAEARMEDIADECGLSKATLYLYYRSKDDLIAGLLINTFREQMQGLRLLLDMEGTVRERLLTMTQLLVTAMQQNTDWLAISFEFYAVAGRQPNVREVLKEYFAEYRTALALLFRQGIERAEVPAFDTNQAAIALAAMYEGMFLLWITDPDAIPLSDIMPNAIRFLLDGVTTVLKTDDSGNP
ncbi:MAG: TetR/AcrR family transcriptional regulator [Aggregatilineales bacterium]